MSATEPRPAGERPEESLPEEAAPRPPAPGRSGFGAVVAVARWDLLDLGIVIGFALLALGVGIGIIARHLGTTGETARLEGIVQRQRDIEASIRAYASRIEEGEARLRALKERIPDLPPGEKPDRYLERFLNELRRRAHDVEVAVAEPRTAWQTKRQKQNVGPEGEVVVLQHDRTIELKGTYGSVLQLVAALEAWKEYLVGVRALSIQAADPGNRGPVGATLELSIYQIEKEGPAPR